MVKQSDNPYDAFANANGDLKKISDLLLLKYKDKYLEIYIGDQYETLDFADSSQPCNSIIYGKLLDLYDRFLVLDCLYFDQKSNSTKSGNIIFINTFQIRAFTELNEQGSLGDIFLSTQAARKVKKHFFHKK